MYSKTNDVTFLSTPPVWRLTLQDLWQGLISWRIWFLLGWNDIKIRYRRSQLGPLWITINMSITIYIMGLLYSHLLKTDITSYYPFLASGLLAWTLIASILNESTLVLVEGKSFLNQIKIPFSIFIWRMITRNLIIFFHNIVVVIPVLFFFHTLHWQIIALLPGLFLVSINAFIFGLLLAIVGSRYRDIPPIMSNGVQVIFFLTPILWGPSALPPNKTFFIKFNPLVYYVDLIRAPLLGKLPAISTLETVLLITVLSAGIVYYIFHKTRSHLIYWL